MIGYSRGLVKKKYPNFEFFQANLPPSAAGKARDTEKSSIF
jgi:hypothetical protein